MESKTTNGIEIQVETEYQVVYSIPSKNLYIFAYNVSIKNLNEQKVQLLRRRWEIYDAGAFVNEVEGPGVVGEQPVLITGGIHKYTSGCQFSTPNGMMKGQYMFVNLESNKQFYADIPEFHMKVEKMFL